MAKMLAQRDFDLSNIGELFELDEVIPKFEQEERTNDKTGEPILGSDGRPRKFDTNTIIGYKYSVTILDGQFRKKATQVTVLGAELVITNEMIMKSDSVKCRFESLEVSMSGNPMYYKADKIILEKDAK
ncbi:TPA: hypothetical protein ACGBG5_002545 [Enterococcus faecalis]